MAVAHTMYQLAFKSELTKAGLTSINEVVSKIYTEITAAASNGATGMHYDLSKYSSLLTREICREMAIGGFTYSMAGSTLHINWEQ